MVREIGRDLDWIWIGFGLDLAWIGFGLALRVRIFLGNHCLDKNLDVTDVDGEIMLLRIITNQTS